MPVLATAVPPPHSEGTISQNVAASISSIPSLSQAGRGARGEDDGISKPTRRYSMPVVSLDVDIITDEFAARLAISLLGHVLFLKSQVPLPVLQLARMANNSSKSTARALKQRTELLSSFDTLSSHLSTTFTALSSALACVSNPIETTSKLTTGRAYLGIFVGSNTPSAKSKVIYAVDGLELRKIGARDDGARLNENGPRSDTRSDSEEEDDGEASDESGQEEVEEESGEEEASGEEDDTVEESDQEEGSDSNEDIDSDFEAEPETDPTSSPPPSPPPARPSHAEHERALQAAERLLARTLAAADAEADEGEGMSADMAPTQTHILLRAPRRFVHPAWVPKQNISASLDNTLYEFLEESGLSIPDFDTFGKPRRKSQKGKKVEGVWITPRGGLDGNAVFSRYEEGCDEWDEMIWWTWDGKIVGFSEW